jgi:hypothetical protein
VLGKILGEVQMAGENYRLQVRKPRRVRQSTVVDEVIAVDAVPMKLGCLGLIQIRPKENDFLVGPRLRRAVCEYCQRAGEIPRALEHGQELTFGLVFQGNARRRADFQAWIAREFPAEAFPCVECARSERQFKLFAERLRSASVITMTKPISAAEINLTDHYQVGPQGWVGIDE